MELADRLNPQDQEILDKILQKDVPSLTENDIAILRARRTYLSEEDTEKFAKVLEKKSSADLKAKVQEITCKKVKVGTTREELEKIVAEAGQGE